MRRKLKMFFLMMVMMLSAVHVQGAEEMRVIVNGHALKLEDPLVTEHGKTYISLREIGTALGYAFNWSEENKTANLKSDKMIVALQPDNRWYSKKNRDGKLVNYVFDAADVPKMIENKLYVPISHFTTVTGGSLIFDEERNTYSMIGDADLCYPDNKKAILYAGNGQKGKVDGLLAESRFQYAQSICATENGIIYVVDAGVIRKIEKGQIETVKMEPAGIKVTVLKALGNEVYALSTPYKNGKNEQVISLFKLHGQTLREVVTVPVNKSKIIDFTIISGRMIGTLEQNLIENKRYLTLYNIDSNTAPTKIEVAQDFNCLATDRKAVYLGSSQRGSIYCFDIASKALTLFAGVDHSHQFKDGSEPLFGAPRRMVYSKGALYVLDYNLLRKVIVGSDGKAGASMTIAGKVTPLINPMTSKGDANSMLISSIDMIDFTVMEEQILLTDVNHYKILCIQ